MPPRTKRKVITADASLAQAKKSSPALKALLSNQHGHGHAENQLREEYYNGHHIVIKTTYEVTVDGKMFHASLGVSNSGNVQYHGIPNVGFASAMDLMRCVIDQFPEEFTKPEKVKSANRGEQDHAVHDHGMHEMSRKKVKKPRAQTAGLQ